MKFRLLALMRSFVRCAGERGGAGCSASGAALLTPPANRATSPVHRDRQSLVVDRLQQVVQRLLMERLDRIVVERSGKDELGHCRCSSRAAFE